MLSQFTTSPDRLGCLIRSNDGTSVTLNHLDSGIDGHVSDVWTRQTLGRLIPRGEAGIGEQLNLCQRANLGYGGDEQLIASSFKILYKSHD
ncbi:hypothetical protein PoB_006229400 [Plakobranchus ocellatus]|uniref:Uncharacterized protein n=1 Tax=Plakobranchus ocellatus TaxID=259542 RepID=A0AAV4CV82_9GAST|nr:hypothetical protein PoB_006229400 [Plakobranchus ocellatus]